MSFRGINVRQAGDRIIFRASLKNSAGAKVTASGGTSLRTYEVQSDGGLLGYDWNSNTFKSGSPASGNVLMVHQTVSSGSFNTGIWTYALTTVTGFTRGNIYLAQVNNTTASPTDQEQEWQYGDGEGDFTVTNSGQVSPASGLWSGQPITLLSGFSYPASGINATVPVGSLSGVVANSGLFVSVPIASVSGITVTVPIGTLSGIQPISGTFVSVPIASISGAVANSGLFVSLPIASVSGINAVVPIATLSGIQPISGTTVSVPIASISGVNVVVPVGIMSGVYLASGSIFTQTFASGMFGTSGNFATAWGNSGAVVTAINLDKSGYTANTISGQTYPASGAFTNVPPSTLSGVVANSGLFVSLPIASVSGITVVIPLSTLSGIQPISGTTVSVPLSSISGVQIASGSFTNVFSGQLSGQPITLLSGLSYIASGINTVSLLVSGTAYLASGQSVLLNSGQQVSVYSGQLSGQQLNLLSGNSVSIWSGSFVNIFSGGFVTVGSVLDKSGYSLAPHGVDTIYPESGMNLRQATSIIAAACGGQLSGAGTSTILIEGANASGTNRVTATVNSSGDRIAVTLNLPT